MSHCTCHNYDATFDMKPGLDTVILLRTPSTSVEACVCVCARTCGCTSSPRTSLACTNGDLTTSFFASEWRANDKDGKLHELTNSHRQHTHATSGRKR
eukprot:114229-Amphidinium_carterae.1